MVKVFICRYRDLLSNPFLAGADVGALGMTDEPIFLTFGMKRLQSHIWWNGLCCELIIIRDNLALVQQSQPGIYV